MKKLFAICITLFSLNLYATTLVENNLFVKEQQEYVKRLKEEIFTQEKINKIEKEKLFNTQKSSIIKQTLNKKEYYPSLSKSLIKKYYKNFSYKPFFVDFEGLKKIGYSLLENIKNDSVLKPHVYTLFNLKDIEKQIKRVTSKKKLQIIELIKLDFMLVNTYNRYMKYLSKGFIDWETFQEELKKLDKKAEIIANWQKYDVRKNIRKLLYEAVKKENINYAINQVNYTFPKAEQLSNTIKEYEKLAQAGGYIKVPNIKKSLKKGNYYPEIKSIRKRLIQSKDLKNDKCIINEKNKLFKGDNSKSTQIPNNKITIQEKDCKELYDKNVFQAIKSFQKSHGLVQDGVIGKNTIKKLNTPIEVKIKKMRVNLERMRWMPRTLGKKYLIVNIPDYNLKMYEEGQVKLKMPVIVGEKKHPTPIFSHKISEIVLNPYWRIPQRIVKREIIPKLVKDPTYLKQQDIKAFENWDHKSMNYDISNVDWSMYLNNDLIGNSKNAPMRFIQLPGKKNPLGKMKFMFPNRYSVYLHDTPFKDLFKRKKRAFSHGCIRLSKPYELLKTITQEDNIISYKEAKEILKNIEKTDIDLSKKIPIHIIYLTSWIDENGKVQFRDDIYNYDKMQNNLLYNQSL